MTESQREFEAAPEALNGSAALHELAELDPQTDFERVVRRVLLDAARDRKALDGKLDRILACVEGVGSTVTALKADLDSVADERRALATNAEDAAARAERAERTAAGYHEAYEADRRAAHAERPSAPATPEAKRASDAPPREFKTEMRPPPLEREDDDGPERPRQL